MGICQHSKVSWHSAVNDILKSINNVSLNPANDEVYLIQYYVIQFVVDLRQVGGFLMILRFPPSIKLTATI
jgi:hypothetical protein